MGYLSDDKFHGRVVDDKGAILKEGIAVRGRGEVCVRGPNIFKGYYRAPGKTAEVLEADGWYHTGDVGCWLPDGSLKIVDRKKNIFKLSQGEYVAAEKIENVYCKSDWVASMFVYGDSLQSCLVGIIVPDEVVLKRWAADHIKTGRVDVAALCEHEDVRKEIMADLKRVAADAGLRGFEKIKAFHLEAAAWTPDDIASVLTPTFKLKRNVAKERYGKEIEAMYASGIGVVAGRTGVKQE
jgi:long-chain acyl-CoA synthetase